MKVLLVITALLFFSACKKGNNGDELKFAATSLHEELKDFEVRYPSIRQDNAPLELPASFNYAPDAPKRFAPIPSRTVLLAMEELRLRFYRSDKDDTFVNDDLNLASPMDVKLCLGFSSVPYWSDLSHHYFCQLPPQARTCYSDAFAGGKSRLEAFEICKAQAHTTPFQWVLENQEKIFKYLVFAETYAFDLKQQQEIINTFYRVKDPNNETECSKRRYRQIDIFKMRCSLEALVNERYTQPLSPAGR